MKNFNFFKLLFLIATLSLVACHDSSRTDRTWLIQNNSSTSIQLNVIDNYGVTKNGALAVGESVVVGIDSKDEPTSVVINPGNKFREINITSEKGTMKKDFTLETNWVITVEKVRRTPKLYKHEYKLVVKDTDF